jgi:hypothetical protein
MYPGGGKLFARWLPLFSATLTEQLEFWHNSVQTMVLDFPWQGWSNANFQPTFSKISLAVPDGRVRHSPGGQALFLSDLAIRLDGRGFPQLFEKQQKRAILFTDLGLEAPETRPPVMQILWHLGVPIVSSGALLPDGFKWEKQGLEILHRPRVEYKSLVLARAAWVLPSSVWEKIFSEEKLQAERIGLGVAAIKALGIPARFFGQFTENREKPQFFDLESPISALLFEKTLRAGVGNLLLTELLPMPEQWLGDRAWEFVLEFQDSSYK